jgi:hypothetical protein
MVLLDTRNIGLVDLMAEDNAHDPFRVLGTGEVDEDVAAIDAADENGSVPTDHAARCLDETGRHQRAGKGDDDFRAGVAKALCS